MSLRAAIVAFSALALIPVWIAQGQAPTSTAAPTFPLQLITGTGQGPALFLGTGSDAAGVGFISSGVPVEVVEAPAGDRVLVRVRGGMRVRAHLATTRLAGIVQRRGRIRGTPVYVAPGSIVQVLGFEADGRARIAAEVMVRGRPIRYEGSFPVIGLGATRPTVTPDQLAPGTLQRLHLTASAPLRDAPNGAVIETLTAGDYTCRVVETQGGFHSVILGEGDGPYLTGFVQGELVAAASTPASPPARAEAAFPQRLRADAELPLVHLPAGTRVTFEGETVAQLDRPGYARIVERHTSTGEADVFVAVDDDVAVRGMVELTALGEAVR